MATPLGTLDRTPPPFFRQGPSALTKLTFCSALAIFLMVADTRFKLTQPMRTMVATVLHPVVWMNPHAGDCGYSLRGASIIWALLVLLLFAGRL